MTKPDLSTVTLCAATSINVEATIAALRQSTEQAVFARCVLFTDVSSPNVPMGIEVVPIAPLRSSADYSEFILGELADFISTSHCLIVQWDGFVIDGALWDSEFLNMDYIGAPWPQFEGRNCVGNGGFSLRSRKLLAACQDRDFRKSHPEDLAICRSNRPMLESRYGIRFADQGTAERFSFERSPVENPTFGFHGVFNMIPIVGEDRFWALYRTLDDQSTAFVDFHSLWRQFGGSRFATRRRVKLLFDRLSGLFRRQR